MSGSYDRPPYDRPRVYVSWNNVRPKTLRGWTALVGFAALAFAALALIAVIASTLFFVALVVVIVAAVVFFVGNLFRPRPRRGVQPYKPSDIDA
jgi:hypothetical protein